MIKTFSPGPYQMGSLPLNETEDDDELGNAHMKELKRRKYKVTNMFATDHEHDGGRTVSSKINYKGRHVHFSSTHSKDGKITHEVED